MQHRNEGLKGDTWLMEQFFPDPNESTTKESQGHQEACQSQPSQILGRDENRLAREESERGTAESKLFGGGGLENEQTIVGSITLLDFERQNN